MITLFIDTSLSSLVIGIVKDNKLLYSNIKELDNDLSKYTLPTTQQALANLQLKPNDIDTIMVVNGPGSFTGIRIGITIAKVYAWALNKKVIPISGLKARAISSLENDYIIAIIDVKDSYYYAGIYNKHYKVIMSDRYINQKDLILEIKKLGNNFTIVSDQAFKIDKFKAEKRKLDILKIVQYHQHDAGVNPHYLSPCYLKKIAVEQ